MIPKIIHYCWLSNDPVPTNLQKCIVSWRKNLPDYKFILWNFERFNKDSSIWVKQAFENKKYAFAADYIRLYALYHYGGIYLDMDVEVLKSFNDFLELNSMICWQKDIGGLEVAAFGVCKNSPWIKCCLDYYTNRHFEQNGKLDMKPLPNIVENILKANGYKLVTVNNILKSKNINENLKEIPVFTPDFFSPNSYKTHKLSLTPNSITIHWFAGSWIQKPYYEILEAKFWAFWGLKNLNIINKIVWRFKK